MRMRRHASGIAGLVLAILPGRAPAQAAPPRPIEVLERAWPDHPEWVAMLVDILAGSQLGPDDGWFRKATARTRYGWDATRARLDRDGDGVILPAEFAGPAADFARLDRDGDGTLSATDFDFSAHALTMSVGAMVFMAADRDANGKVTREEFNTLFDVLAGDDSGFLSLADLQRSLSPPPARRPPSGGNAARPAGPSRATLLRGLFRQEIGSLQPGPRPDEPAPDFTLRTVDGTGEITLSKLIGPKPVVLVFGNFTCGPFRAQGGNVEKLYRRHGDRATFLMVYVREAHPTDGWTLPSNERAGVALPQPRDYGERVAVARTCQRSLGLGFPMLVDGLDDRVGARYSGMPSRLYLIDRRGRIAYQSGRGPFGFKPAELEQALLLNLNEGPAPTVQEPAK